MKEALNRKKIMNVENLLQSNFHVRNEFKKDLLASLLKRFPEEITLREKLYKLIFNINMVINKRYLYIGFVALIVTIGTVSYFFYANNSGLPRNFIDKNTTRTQSPVIDLSVYRIEDVDSSSYKELKKVKLGTLFIDNDNEKYLLKTDIGDEYYVWPVLQTDMFAVDENGNSYQVNPISSDSLYEAASVKINEGDFMDATIVYENGVEKIVPANPGQADTFFEPSASGEDTDSSEIIIACPEGSTDEECLEWDSRERERIYNDCVATEGHKILEMYPAVCVYPDGKSITGNKN